MWPYWFMFLLAVLGVLTTQGIRTSSQRLAWLSVVFLFAILVGYRHEVGGDWGAYARHLESMRYYTFQKVILGEDPGYYLLNWLVFKLNGSIYWVNFVCATLVMFGLNRFAKDQPLPWLALLVAVPYLLVVVAMGYSRQGAALGLALFGLAALGKHQTRQFIIWVLLGALFHKSAVLLLPIAALSATKNKTWTFVWVGVSAAAGAYFLVLDSADALWANYVEADIQSQGGLIRVLMNAVPSALMLLFRNRLFYSATERKLWLWLAIFSLVTIPLVTVSSTAVDRVALYFIPIQLFVFSRLPFITKDKNVFRLITFGIVAYYALVLFVWLNFAIHSKYWLPYKNVFFQF